MYRNYNSINVLGTRTRPELSFVPEPVTEPPVQYGTATGTRLCHRYSNPYQALSPVP